MKEKTVDLAYRWILFEYGPGEQQQRTLELPMRELIVGRTSDVDVTIPCNSVSKRHARLSFADGHLLVEDLDSKNGTHVNGQSITYSMVVEGDLLQFANALYRVGKQSSAPADGTIEEGILPWAQTLLLFDRLMNERAVVPNFQPIIRLDDHSIVGHELLARSDLDGLTNPALMFGAAERLGQEAAFSELMRQEGAAIASQSDAIGGELFLNTHPTEVITNRLLDSLRDLRATFPNLPITIEIHEAAVTDHASMREFRDSLKHELSMKLSYDDFGAGQGRLLELGEVPPDVLKFDMRLIRDIDTASGTRQEMLANLVRLAGDLGTVPLAEGVETEAEHQVCLQIGFELGQGFLYGRPRPIQNANNPPLPQK